MKESASAWSARRRAEGVGVAFSVGFNSLAGAGGVVCRGGCSTTFVGVGTECFLTILSEAERFLEAVFASVFILLGASRFSLTIEELRLDLDVVRIGCFAEPPLDLTTLRVFFNS